MFVNVMVKGTKSLRRNSHVHALFMLVMLGGPPRSPRRLRRGFVLIEIRRNLHVALACDINISLRRSLLQLIRHSKENGARRA